MSWQKKSIAQLLIKKYKILSQKVKLLYYVLIKKSDKNVYKNKLNINYN